MSICYIYILHLLIAFFSKQYVLSEYLPVGSPHLRLAAIATGLENDVWSREGASDLKSVEEIALINTHDYFLVTFSSLDTLF